MPVAPLAGSVIAAAVLLVVSGVLKVTNPGPAARSLASARGPSSTTLARLIGVGEIVVGTSTLVIGGTLLTGVLALAYLGFAAFAFRLMRVDPQANCGCFGSSRSAVGATHVAVNTVVAVAVSSTLWSPVEGVSDVVANSPARGLPLLAMSAVLAAAMALLLSGRLGRPGASVRGDDGRPG